MITFQSKILRTRKTSNLFYSQSIDTHMEMTEKLGLPNKDFKAFIIKIFQ